MMAQTLVLLLVSGLAGSFGQQVRDVPAQPAIGTAVVSGTVFAGANGSDPARKARVLLNSAGGRAVGLTATTDDGGRFEFRDVPAGRFTLQAVKAGYLLAAYGAARPNRAGTPVAVADGGRVTGLTMRLVRGGAVTGTVRDARGAPVPGATVSAARYVYSSVGERRLGRQASDALTDDRGVYRVWGLPPGDYVVMAAPRGNWRALSPSEGADFSQLSKADVDRALAEARAGLNAFGAPATAIDRANPPTPPNPPTANYAPVFHPGATDLALATTLTLTAGEERAGVDIAIRLVRTARVSGSVRMPDGTAVPRTIVTLSGAGEAANMLAGTAFVRARSIQLDATGRFTLPDVAPGTYIVLAKSQPAAAAAPATPIMWAVAEVAVDGADANLSLELRSAMTVSGRVVFDGASPPPADPTALEIFMVPPGTGGNLSAGPAGGHVAADGTFTFAGVTPGSYRMLQVFARPWIGSWTLRSALANGRDTYDTPLIVAPGENIDWVLTYTDRPTEISGALQDATGRPATDYFIVVFPRDRADWRPGSFRIRSTRPANDGAFSIKGLLPGDYLLAALTDLETEDSNTPSFLEELATLAIRITLAEGQTVKQDLKIGR